MFWMKISRAIHYYRPCRAIELHISMYYRFGKYTTRALAVTFVVTNDMHIMGPPISLSRLLIPFFLSVAWFFSDWLDENWFRVFDGSCVQLLRRRDTRRKNECDIEAGRSLLALSAKAVGDDQSAPRLRGGRWWRPVQTGDDRPGQGGQQQPQVGQRSLIITSNAS